MTDEEYFALERQALMSPMERDLEEFTEMMLRELEASSNAQELEEVEVVKPEELARRRAWNVPEVTIEAIIRQKRWVREQRRIEERVTLPDYAYRMPRLREIEAQRWGFAK